jgi:hypothetical protein
MEDRKADSMASLMDICMTLNSLIVYFLYRSPLGQGAPKLRPMGPLNQSLFLSSAPSMVYIYNARSARH